VELSQITEAALVKQCCPKERAEYSAKCVFVTFPIFVKESKTLSSFYEKQEH